MTATNVYIAELEAKSVSDLRELAREHKLKGISRLKKNELILRILRERAEREGLIFGGGILEILKDGIGFLRTDDLKPSPDDVFVSPALIDQHGLRMGDLVIGQVKPPQAGERFRGMLRIDAVNGEVPERAKARPHFLDLIPIFPRERLRLETKPDVLSTRLIDLLAPIGRGQRGLVVAPARTGKTTILKRIADGIATNHPDVHLMVVLIGERPEEVTDMDRSVEGEVFGSTFDEDVSEHVRIAELSLARAKRLVEHGRHVLILLDSITRLARAYNLAVPQSGRMLSGGLDPAALYPSKHFFGAARNIEGGGSLTIIGTCLVDTGSRLDDSVYEEFKGTGNMEIVLSRRLEERRVFPAIDIEKSGTRREDLLLDEHTLGRVWLLRRMIEMMGGGDSAAEALIERLGKSATNEEFLDTIKPGAV